MRVGVLGLLGVGIALTAAPATVAATGAVAGVHAQRQPGTTTRVVVSGHNHRAVVQESSNWSGYVRTGAGLTSASGSWVVPSVHAPATRKLQRKNLYSGTWVGIDGNSNGNLIQAGTEQDWLRGTTSYQAWWEILPAPETPIPSIAVHPGDTMSVTITKGNPDWTIAVSDVTTNHTAIVVQPYVGPGTSAEWIHEAVTVGRRVSVLPPMTPVTFDLATVNGANAALVSGDGVVMANRRGAFVATPSVPDSDNDGFTVAYGGTAPAPPSS